MSTRFDGRVALITGAARGIGLATAAALLAEGAAVAAWDVSAGDEIEPLCELFPARLSRDSVDIRDGDAVLSGAGRVVERFGRIDILVNNAGVTDGYLETARVTETAWRRVIDTNLTGALHCVQAVLPAMRARQYGRIVNLSSIFATRGFPGQSSYAASKSALLALTRVWAHEFAAAGITVNAVTPGYIDTPMNRANAPDFVKFVVARTPLRRLGSATDVASAVAFLASEEAGFITGAVLPVDGGLSA